MRGGKPSQFIPFTPNIPPEYSDISHARHEEKKTAIDPTEPNTSTVFDIAARVLSAAVNFFLSICVVLICYRGQR